MKVRIPVLILLAALFVQSCAWLYPAPLPERNMVMYYAAAHNNNLSGQISSNIENIKTGYLPNQKDTNNVMMVYYHLADNHPRLSRFCSNDDGEFVEEILMDYPHSSYMPTYSLEEISISQVLADAQTAYPSTRKSIIFSTHGSGFLPENYSLYDEQATKAMGPDDNIEIGLPELHETLKGYHFDLIIFDCCFMGGIETAYELSNLCDYVIGAPTETMSAGITREDVMEPLFLMEAEAAGVELCKRFMAHVRQESQYSNSGTIGMYKTCNLPELASVCSDIFQNAGTKTYTISVSDIQQYHRNEAMCFYDLDDFVKHLLTSDEGVVDPTYSNFSTALSNVVIFKDTTPYFLTLPIDQTKYSGISTYIPRSSYAILNEYYKGLAWNKSTKLVN